MNKVKLKCGNFMTAEQFTEKEADRTIAETQHWFTKPIEKIPVGTENKPQLYSIDGGRGK